MKSDLFMVPTSIATRIDTKRDFAVTVLPRMIKERSRHASVYCQGNIYIIDDIEQPCERYSISANEWEALPNLPQPSYGIRLTVLESKDSLFAFGQTNTPHILRFDLKTLTWEVKEVAFPSINFFERVILFKMGEDLLYLAREDGVYAYNPTTNSVEVISEGRAGDVLYVTGGLRKYDLMMVPANIATRIDTKRDFAVTVLPRMIHERSRHASVFCQGYIYAIGDGYLTCERYSISANEWEALPSLPQPCHGIRLTVVESTSSLFAFVKTNTPHILRFDLKT
eukprot:CAMPEP_0204919624 /NCGR_PEP_ID=MMETSP1397-20131031/16926_1 /ASSEMBLY_ACC=CAM_ASM_000891 /TAXON_ID=49980 /ORGANISM="Climacostomum Climacostomum virens, Strain Stock W-24" /LENGTH=281 /DNA_ID=CAMNT_0052093231 /DNA_START=177 /DNA_END=1018 /DNA_ORIENTATION=+